MVKESRGEVSDGTGYKSFTNTNRITIPDNDPGRDFGKEANGWEDNVVITSEAVDGFLGAPITGNWTLTVRDTAGADVGEVVSWGLNVLAN